LLVINKFDLFTKKKRSKKRK